MTLLARQPNVVAKLSGLGTFLHRNDPAHIGFVVGETVRLFGAGRCMFGSNFPIEKLWTRYALFDAYRAATQTLSVADRHAIFHDTAAGIYRWLDFQRTTRFNEGNNHMALEIKILDYGDIELESSFLVLGRDCGRTRRVPTYRLLILGGPWPMVVHTAIATIRSWKALECAGCSTMRT